MIGNTEGMVGIFVTVLTREKMCLQNTAVLRLYKCSRFVCVLHWFCLGQCLQRNLTAELEERFPEIKSLNDEHQILARSHKSVAKMYSPAVFATLSIESKFIIIRLIPVGKYPCLTGYPYPHRVIILVVCTLKFLVDSYIRKLQNRGISTKRRRAPSPPRSLCLSIWKSRPLLAKRKVEILAS